MPTLNIPDEGLRIPRPSMPVSDEKPNARAAYPAAFALKINITERFLEELSSGKTNALTLNTGKGRMSLQVGSNQFEFMHTQEMFYNELYRQSDENGPISPMGLLKDKLELLEVAEKKNADADLLALKKEMEALQQKKKDKSVQLVSNPSKLGPELSGRRGLIAAKKAGIQQVVLKTKVNKRTMFSSSMPNSPALTATGAGGKDVTSAPKPKSVRKEPLFLPLIHLLALGPEKEQTLAMKTHTGLDKCSGIVIQIANRGMSGRWELLDEIYKELDVWRFKYPKPEMREQAIENAEDAFDRLKLAEDAPEWEMLRRPEDRGKPRPPRQPRKKQPEPEVAKKKPVAAPSPALPPTIKISKDDSVTGSPIFVAEPMARSISQPVAAATTTVTKARGNAENNALKKILGNKKATPKAKTTSTPKVAAPKEKKLPTTSSSTNSPATLPAKPSPAISSNSPLASSASATVKTKPPNARYINPKYKSAEFISDSDSDDNMNIDTPPKNAPSSSSSSSSGQPLYAKSARANMAKTADVRAPKIPSKRPAAISISGKQETSSSPATNGHKRTASMSASPAKPSPLGSSPPMTASDIVRQSSTASSSPLSYASVATPDDLGTPMIHPSPRYKPAPISTPKSSTEKGSAKPRYIPDNRDSASPQHKRKAEEPAAAERPRKRVLSSSSEDSDGSRARKAPMEERPTVARKAPSTSQVSEPTKPKKKDPVKKVANGVSKKDFEEVRQQRKDMPRPTYASSTASTTSNVSMSSSDMSSRGGRSKFRAAEENIALLAKYKRLHDEYRTRYEKVLHDPDPPQDRVNQVMDLHDRLAEMKIMIRRTVLAS